MLMRLRLSLDYSREGVDPMVTDVEWRGERGQCEGENDVAMTRNKVSSRRSGRRHVVGFVPFRGHSEC